MKLLYFDSLNEHMKKYMDDVKLSDINDSLQAQKIKLLRQIELSNISQAEAANKLEELKKIAIALKSNEVAPFSKTAAPEEYSPITRYEAIIKNRPQIKNQNQSLIDELKKKLQMREVKNTMNDMLNNVTNQSSLMDDLKSEMERRKEVKNTMNDMLNNVTNQSSLMRDLKSEMERRKKVKNNMSSIDIAEMKKTDKAAISSSKASTASSQADFLEVGRPNFNTVKKELKNKYMTDFKLTEKEANKRVDTELSRIAKNKKIAYMNSKLSGGSLSQRKFRSKIIL